ncbi:hypothetical protein ACVWV0_001126 [Ewingella americana]
MSETDTILVRAYGYFFHTLQESILALRCSDTLIKFN